MPYTRVVTEEVPSRLCYGGGVRDATLNTRLAFGQGGVGRVSFDRPRVAASGAKAAGVVWMVLSLAVLVLPRQGSQTFGSSSFYALETAFAIAAGGMLVGLVGLYRRFLATGYGWLGRWGFSAALIGTVFILGACLADVAAGREVLGGSTKLVEISSVLIGISLLGVYAVRGRVLPLWCGAALAIASPVSVVLAHWGGEMVLGLSWLALGYVLRNR